MKAPHRGPWPLLALAAAAAVILTSGCTLWRLNEARTLARDSQPHEQRPNNALLHMLVVGDSTGVGTGASQADRSVAGLLGQAHPKLALHNRARDGAKFDEVPAQLTAARGGPDAGYDLILISVGGNDVIRGTDAAELRQDIELAFAAARQRLAPGGLVLVQAPGMVGNSPFFAPPLSALMNSRAEDLHAAVKAAASNHGVQVIDMARPKDDDPFVQNPELNASDGLHPSDAGYKLWRDELLAQSDLGQRLAPAK